MNVYVRELSRELGRRGISVDMFTRSQDPSAPTVVELEHNVRVVNLHTGPSAPYDKSWVLTYVPEFVSRARCFADGEDLTYDLIHSHYWLSGQAALALRRSWGVPVVHMFHTLGAMKNRVARGEQERESKQRIAIERNQIEAMDAIVAATPLDREQMIAHYGVAAERIDIVPCGVDLRRFYPRDPAVSRAALGLPHAPHKLLLLVGRIEPLKGIDALICAVALLLDRRPDWRDSLTALVVGGGAEQAPASWNAEQRRLDALRHELGVAHAIRFMGAQPQDELPAFYSAADIVTMPSHYESFGMATLEGLACGRPVVATKAGGPAYIVEDGISGFLIAPDDHAALAGHFERLLGDEALRGRMGAAASTRAQHFGWSAVASNILHIYRDTLERTTLGQTLTIQPRAAASCGD